MLMQLLLGSLAHTAVKTYWTASLHNLRERLWCSHALIRTHPLSSSGSAAAALVQPMVHRQLRNAWKSNLEFMNVDVQLARASCIPSQSAPRNHTCGIALAVHPGREGYHIGLFLFSARPFTRLASLAFSTEDKYLFDFLWKHVCKEGRGSGTFPFPFTFPRALSHAFSLHEATYSMYWLSREVAPLRLGRLRGPKQMFCYSVR